MEKAEALENLLFSHVHVEMERGDDGEVKAVQLYWFLVLCQGFVAGDLHSGLNNSMFFSTL